MTRTKDQWRDPNKEPITHVIKRSQFFHVIALAVPFLPAVDAYGIKDDYREHIPRAELGSSVEVEGLLIWYDWITLGFPPSQSTFQELDP